MKTPRLLKPVAGLLITALIAGGCSGYRDSGWNPGNWFSRSTAVTTTTDGTGANNPLIPERRASIFRSDTDNSVVLGALVSEIEDVSVERRPGGAVVVASGLVRRAGAYDVSLVLDEEASSDTTLVYDLRSFFSDTGPVPQTTAARRVTAAVTLSDQDLATIRSIRVNGRTNARETRR